ncbi:growth hormone-inducible transmembrane protein-like [Agrilus planipennis]|uniref:Growth hormone-inducible transmembrane protein-like n=1 Tax=Agrilus planipennis TaxID=224129 RepID=A0A7F5RHJ4_AGRPL|nr:growth hormone-inducible transmembrane protein-like [Agrilus planipennis]
MNRLILKLNTRYGLKLTTAKRFNNLTISRLICIKNNLSEHNCDREEKETTAIKSTNGFKHLLAGSAFLGLCTFCCQGFIRSKSDKEVWPNKVKDYLTLITLYDQISLAVAVVSGLISVRHPPLLRCTYNHVYLTSAIGIGLIGGTGLLIRQMPYEKDFSSKHAAWLIHEVLLGGFGGNMLFTAGPLLLRLVLYFAGAVTALNLVVLSSSNEEFLKVRGPISEFLGVVICACYSHWFLPATNVYYSKMQSPLLSISLYGCLIYGCVLLWFDVVKRIFISECYSQSKTSDRKPLDPINITIATKTFAFMGSLVADNDCGRTL